MRYFEFNFKTADDQTAEILMALLAEKGFDTFEQNDTELSAYIPEKNFSVAETEFYLNDLQQKFVFTWQQKLHEKKNWNEEWEKNFNPVVVGDRCLIRAPFHSKNGDYEFEIIIEPRMSFGTGHHESTHLMMEEMLGLDFSRKQICDAGSGTGILSILAVKKGANHVLAIDNNDWAYQNAMDNVSLNRVYDEISVELGELELMSGKQFDIILANINKHIILQNIPLFFRSLQAGGLLIISGILQNDLNDIVKEAGHYFFNLVSTRTKGDWVCAVLQNG